MEVTEFNFYLRNGTVRQYDSVAAFIGPARGQILFVSSSFELPNTGIVNRRESSNSEMGRSSVQSTKSYPFQIGYKYRRRDIYKIIGIPEDTKGGNWDTGYNKLQDDYFLFCNVGTPGRTGHDYGNRFDGHYLHWYAKGGTRLSQPQIQELLKPPGNVYIFFRLSDKKPFTFAGFGKPYSYQDEIPVQITWEIIDDFTDASIYKSEEELYKEGSLKRVYVNAYERNPAARSACIEKYGYECQVCGINLSDIYGELGKDFIHVHHIVPVSEIGNQYQVDPEKDLIPVCANCHTIIHRRKPAYSISEVSMAIKDNLGYHRNRPQKVKTSRLSKLSEEILAKIKSYKNKK
jgi:5-methylcytosine-specific restriction protein A